RRVRVRVVSSAVTPKRSVVETERGAPSTGVASLAASTRARMQSRAGWGSEAALTLARWSRPEGIAVALTPTLSDPESAAAVGASRQPEMSPMAARRSPPKSRGAGGSGVAWG
ncbi:MAG: hypothetical protein ACK5U8_23975, partial [Deltaproteobacteria bacterium]